MTQNNTPMDEVISIDKDLAPEEINNILRANNTKNFRFINTEKKSSFKLNDDIDLDDLDELSKNHRHKDETPTPISKLVDDIIKQAITLHVSDIHIESKDRGVTIRYRVDGVLSNILETDKDISRFMLTRIKVLSGLNISEKRKPQDGKMQYTMGDNRVDLRVSVIPNSEGERCVIRVLDKRNVGKIEKFSTTNKYNAILQMAKNPNGVIIVCGPTGSGKSTTLNHILKDIKTDALNILTIEDPVEYKIDGIGQIQVDEENGMGFSNGLRSILRQDPDVILVGEVRDYETAKMALEASMTGHLVLTTLHTNAAIGAISRLSNLGISGGLISSSLRGVISQRLIRTLCESCKTRSTEKVSYFGEQVQHKYVSNPSGCVKCSNTGYKGRVAIYEILEIDKALKKLISMDSSESEMDKQHRSNSMEIDAIELIEAGKTDINEIYRTLGDG